MGQVWRAQVRADATPAAGPKTLAVKLLRTDLASDPDVVHRFIQERSVLMSLDHPGIVKTVDMVAEGDRLGIVMEFMPGGTLAEALKHLGTLPPSLAVPMVAAVLDALTYAHGKGVLHRDVKPANVLLCANGLSDSSDVKLSDFGIASFVDDQGVHATGLVGSPAYMPPELFTSGVVSAASDVYSTGVMLYELLAGRTPFAGPGTAHTVGYRHVTMEAPVLPVDPRLWDVVKRMMAKRPGDRLSAVAASGALRALPLDALAGAALPPQVAPDWEVAGTIIGSHKSTGGTPKGRQANRDVSPEGAAGSLGTEGGQDADLDPHATILGGAVSEVKLDFSRPNRPVKTKPKPWLIALIVVVSVAVIASGVTVAIKAGVLEPKGEASAAPTWAPAHITGQASATGLRIDLDAETSLAGSVALTVTLNAPRSTGLSGDVLIVVPSATGGGTCPAMAGADWQVATQSTDGVNVPCAYKWPVALTAAQVLPQKLQVTGELGDDLGAWLGDIAKQTSTALTGVTGSAFALQRVTRLSVQVDPVSRTDNSVAVSYRAFAQWQGGQEVLFRNDTLAFQATDLLKSLTGGKGLEGIKVDACPETQVHGIVVMALQPVPSCFLTVTVGDLVSPQANFPINGAGS